MNNLTGTPTSTREQEWQFAAGDLDAARRWLAAQPQGRGERRFSRRPTVTLTDTYYDSPDWMIYRAGYALRLRQSREEDTGGETTEITLKSLVPARHGFAQRIEISQLVNSTDMTAELARTEGIGEHVRELVGMRAVRPLFQARTRRERQHLLEADADLPLAEVDLDETSIESPAGDTLQLTRVEVECLYAEPAAIEAMVSDLRDAGKLTPVELSKFGSGLKAAALDPTGPLVTGSREVLAGQSIAKTQRAVLRRFFSAVLEHEPRVRAGDPAAVHNMRVAARHLEVLLRVFGKSAPDWSRAARGAVRAMVKALGAVRDRDVQLAFIDSSTHDSAPAEREALLPLRNQLAGERGKARASLLRHFDDVRTRVWMESWQQPLRDEPTSEAADSPRTGLTARRLIERLARKLRKRADRIGRDSTPEEFHEVRIRAKRLRYTLDAFESLYGPAADNYARALAKLQDVLGAYHDASVRDQRFAELVANAHLPATTSFAIGRLVERDARALDRCQRKFARAYRRLWRRRWRALRDAMRRQAQVSTPETSAPSS